MCALLAGGMAGAALRADAYEVQCGVEGGDSFGWSVAAGSDFNGDGTPDIAAGAPCASVGTLFRAGRVKVFSGATGDVLLALAGESNSQQLGSALDWIADLDGDGKAELAVGSSTFAAPKPAGGFTLGAGKVDVYSSQGGVIWSVAGTTQNASFGETLGAVGDVNGDGKVEIAVGASGAQTSGEQRGATFLLSGANGAQLSRNNGVEEFDQWGSLAAGAGDIDGDGTPDWLSATRVGVLAQPEPIQAEGETTTTTIETTTTTSTTTTTLPPRAGTLAVFSGKPPYGELRTYHGDTLVDRLGRAAAPAGDADGDTLADLWIGSPGAEPNGQEDAGIIGLYSGTGEKILEIEEPLPQAAAAFGTSVAVPGSLDGGNVSDVVAGAPLGRVSGRSQAGRVHAFSGEDGEVIWTRGGTLVQQRFGQSLDAGFDYDGDGVPDVLVGAPGDTPKGKRGAGSVYVLSGDNDGAILETFTGRRGRETRLFVAGPGLAYEPVVRSFDPFGRRREAEIRPFRGQLTTNLSMSVIDEGRRQETQNGVRTLLAVGTGRGGSTPEVAVYRAGKRRQRVSQFVAGPDGYTGGVNISAGDFAEQEGPDDGDELAVVPADDMAGSVLVRIHRRAFESPFGALTWEEVRNFPAFAPTDKFGNKLINASGANLAAGDLTSANLQEELVVGPAAGLPVVKVFSRVGTLISQWQAFPEVGDGVHPNSGTVVAVGDLDGEGGLEIVTALASGQPWVKAWNANGTSFQGAPSQGFIVEEYGPLLTKGLTIATADVDFDGEAEIVVAPGAGVPGRIFAYEVDGSVVDGWESFLPFGPHATKGLGIFGLDQYWKP